MDYGIACKDRRKDMTSEEEAKHQIAEILTKLAALSMLAKTNDQRRAIFVVETDMHDVLKAFEQEKDG